MMMERYMHTWVIRAAIQKGLLGHIVPEIRWIDFMVEGTTISLAAAFEREPKIGEYKMLNDAAAIARRQLPDNLADYSIIVQCYYEWRDIMAVEHKGYVVYERNEISLQNWEK